MEVVPHPSPGFYSRLFLDSEGLEGLKTSNRHSSLERVCSTDSFQMETRTTVLAPIREGDFMEFENPSDSYFQVPFNPILKEASTLLHPGHNVPVQGAKL